MNSLSSKASVVLLCAAALGACGGNSGDEPSNAASNVAEAPPASAELVENLAAPAATDGSGSFTAEYMAGKWSAIDEDCSETLEFRKDGTVTTPIGTAKWTIAGDSLSIDYGDGSKPTVSKVRVLGPDRIELTHASGTKETERRC